LPRTQVELVELEENVRLHPHELLRRSGIGACRWAAPSAVLAAGGAASDFRERFGAEDFWRQASFVELPDEVRDDSDDARRSSREWESPTPSAPPRVAEYIERHGLYRGVGVERDTHRRFAAPRLSIDADRRNPKAVEWAARLASAAGDDPDLIAVLGGDGAMLRAIRTHWRKRLPFFGVNAGHVGFLLNDLAEPRVPQGDLLLYQLPLLWVQFETPAGVRVDGLAFNDAWVERATGQTAWLRVYVDGVVRMERVVADGMLTSTAAGSTSYARAMGAPPLPFHTPLLLLVGSNVLTPTSWKSAALRVESEVLIETADPVQRPLVGYIDGMPQGPVRSMRVRTSRIAAAELAFLPEHNPAEKLARIQFPAH
jgi:NAD kinase